ncbi:hypothetical protein [Nocardioides sp. Soil805]|uniref:hypothetical protein n=1 Tax=Nocardioides sp. Soil805 TaxID=1736416 RepID=UPI000702C682|nr:hypothetical protein [Nocardioides sp. Soil805]KRF34690.1 hypothetical protein ASG94_10960 [Nocardioides sp. Soil805]
MTTPPATGPETPSPPKDPAVEELEKQTARVKARQDLVEAKLGAVGSLATGVTDGPTNTVTFGAKAGSLAPWLAQSVLAEVAGGLTKAVWTAIDDRAVDGQPVRRVVLVTDDPALLATDLVSRQVQASMQGRTTELGALAGDLTRALVGLRQAVGRYKDEEAERARQAQAGGPGNRDLLASVLDRAEGVAAAAADVAEAQAATAAPEADEEETGSETSGTSPLAAAVDLVRLLAIDYTVTAADVGVDSALLARLTSGRMASAGRDDVVLLDGFAPADNSTTFAAYASLIAALNEVASAARTLRSAKAPVDSEAGEYRLALAEVRKEWEKTLADDEAPDGAAEALEEAVEELSRRLQARVAAAAPAEDMIAACTTLTQVVRTELTALTSADGQGIAPLQRACSRDRLHDRTDDATRVVTHVLLVQATHTGADIVTRRSVLGASGRVGYLGGANAAWVLIDVNGNVVGGGAVDSASHLTHDIATGESRRSLIQARVNAWTTKDPLEKNERWLRAGVLLVALALVVFSLAATWAVVVPD